MRQRNLKRSRLGWASKIINQDFIIVLIELFLLYIAINLMFSVVFYVLRVLDGEHGSKKLFDYIYFSFVTSLTIGYGDLVPLSFAGKALAIIQGVITALYFAMMVSVLSVKMLYPRDSVKFSEKLVYNTQLDIFILRVINTRKDALVNPNIRISITEHNIGDKSAGIFNIPIDYNITYLGKYDFSYSFRNKCKSFSAIEEANKALEHNKTPNSMKSRFRINISLTGSYGFNEIAIYKKYYAEDIVVGKCFKPIHYIKEFYGILGVRYNRIQNFWSDFESFEK